MSQREFVDHGLDLVAAVVEIVCKVPGLHVRGRERFLHSRDGHVCLDVVGATLADEFGPETKGGEVWNIGERCVVIVAVTIGSIGIGFFIILKVILLFIVNGGRDWHVLQVGKVTRQLFLR